jgi:hypothetical protein
MQAAIDANQRLRWVFVQRGSWVTGQRPAPVAPESLAVHIGGTQRPRPLPRSGYVADRDPLAGNAKETLSRLKAPAEKRILDRLDEALS